MSLSKKKEKEIFKVYDTWLYSYLNGDIETYDSFLDDSYRFVGSTDNEEFLNRKDTTEFFKQTADQLAGKAEIRNGKRVIENFGELVILTHVFDAWILSEGEWSYYGRFRFTSTLQEKMEGWRFVYQHFSTPDIMANEGETLGIDKITAENLELRNAIKRRTTELELKNRALEVETSLERIRAKVTMMQQSSDLLDIVVAMRNEFTDLGHRADYFWHMLWLPEKFEKSMTSGDGKRIGMIMELPRDFHSHYKGMDEWEANDEPIMVLALEVDEALDYLHKMVTLGDFKQIDPNAPTEEDIRHIGGITFVMARTSHGEIGYSLPGVVNHPPEEDLNILERFARVFDLAHKRFGDLKRSERQNRETQIELSLERVRSRAMAMQDSAELSDLVDTFFKELSSLDFALQACIINIVDEDNLQNTVWMKSPDVGNIPDSYDLKFENYPFHDAMLEAYRKREAKYIYIIEGNEKKAYDKYLFTDTEFSKVSKEAQDSFKSLEKYVCSFTFSNFGGLQTIGEESLSEENLDILARFGNVFDLTYTRFNDLKLAEAQTREAQIETALERVRSRTMAMHDSSELAETAAVLFEQLKELGIDHDRTNIGIFDEANMKINFFLTTQKGSLVDKSFPASIDESNTLKTFYESFKEKKKSIIVEQKGTELKKWISFITNKLGIPYTPPTRNEKRVQNVGYFSHGMLIATATNSLNDESVRILERFATVFEQTYTRFLDLQKAEAQTRESQIESALERVRSKTMAMHNSRDVKETVKTFFDEVLKLGIDQTIRCGIGILEGHEGMETWSANASDEGEVEMRVGMLNMKIHPMLRGLKKAWKNGEKEYAYYYTAKDVLTYYTALNNEPEYPFNADLNSLPNEEYHNSFFFSSGIIFAFTENPLTEESSAVLHRFADVFGQTYRRFLDLQRAEAQAREAEIELSLERVRNRAMTMQSSEELGDLIITVFKELQSLDMELTRCLLWIFKEEDKSASAWMANSEDPDHADHYDVAYHDHPAYKSYLKAWNDQLPEWEYALKGKSKERWDEILVEGFFKKLPRKVKNAMKAPKKVILSGSFNKYGLIQTAGLEPLSSENKAILKRFSQVFEQNYNRFLDLKKAEKQAREARIEAALEKIRARTMAMQSSSELRDAANLLFLEVQALGINAWSAGYNIVNENKTQSVCWMSSEGELQDPFPLFYTEEASFIEMGTFLKSDEDFMVQELKGQALVNHYDYMISLPELKETFQHIQDAGLSLPTYQINHLCKFSKGFLLFITYEIVPEAHDVFKRFTNVFEQTYTRFLDLQKAERQSKEAQIELALERVRASSMAMHKSEQLAETAQVLFEQFDHLGVIPDRISIAILNEDKRIFEFWSTDQSGVFVNHGHFASIDEPTFLIKSYKAWKEGKETLTIDLKGTALKNWVRYVKEDMKMKLDESKFKGRRVQHCAFFSQGYLLLSSHMPISEETEQLLLRFAKVFQQIYLRFLDHQKAERLAREGVKRASVDRVRAEISSMRNTTDLKRITPLIWNELTTLDVPFIRCGVFIMNEELQQVETHLSTPDGKAIASFELPFENTKPLEQLLPYWEKMELYTDYWDEQAFIESTKILMKRGALSSSETFITKNPPKNLHLHFLPFLQGMLYVGSEIPLTEDELSLAQNLADAFSAAYARYEDFTKLELANKKIEKTLTDLKLTQSQLIQSEKMASLGELTAGIAHEIQNPLNFVNNFSEVSTELVDEMNEELDQGNLEDVKEISIDLKQNLEKINHHGKRAGEIVKGMLQHSRTSTGQKELTDINALTDEYLRLAYHGLRAKDKSFNAKMESHLDPDLPKLEVIPQDIGRVILNMITNAFHAVSEKKKVCAESYEPTVVVQTDKVKDTIEIKVADNGNGMPKKVLDKIFQPFFTTKPTGQGTGLGLSLSYDIVKAHGGELKVTTKENEGATFRIILPI